MRVDSAACSLSGPDVLRTNAFVAKEVCPRFFVCSMHASDERQNGKANASRTSGFVRVLRATLAYVVKVPFSFDMFHFLDILLPTSNGTRSEGARIRSLKFHNSVSVITSLSP